MDGPSSTTSQSPGWLSRAPAPVRILGPTAVGALGAMLATRLITPSLTARRWALVGGGLAGAAIGLSLNSAANKKTQTSEAPPPPRNVSAEEWEEKKRAFQESLEMVDPFSQHPLLVFEKAKKIGDALRAFSSQSGFESMEKAEKFAACVARVPYLDLRGLDWAVVGDLAKEVLERAKQVQSLCLDEAAVNGLGQTLKDHSDLLTTHLIFDMGEDSSVIRSYLTSWPSDDRPFQGRWLTFLFSERPEAPLPTFLDALKRFPKLAYVVIYIGTQEGACLGVEEPAEGSPFHPDTLMPMQQASSSYHLSVRFGADKAGQEVVHQRIDEWLNQSVHGRHLFPFYQDHEAWSSDSASDPLIMEQQLGSLWATLLDPKKVKSLHLVEKGLFRDAKQVGAFLSQISPNVKGLLVSAAVSTREGILDGVRNNLDLRVLWIQDWDHLARVDDPFEALADASGGKLENLGLKFSTDNRFTSGEVKHLPLAGLAKLIQKNPKLDAIELALPKGIATREDLQALACVLPGQPLEVALRWVGAEGRDAESTVAVDRFRPQRLRDTIDTFTKHAKPQARPS